MHPTLTKIWGLLVGLLAEKASNWSPSELNFTCWNDRWGDPNNSPSIPILIGSSVFKLLIFPISMSGKLRFPIIKSLLWGRFKKSFSSWKLFLLHMQEDTGEGWCIPLWPRSEAYLWAYLLRRPQIGPLVNWILPAEMTGGGTLRNSPSIPILIGSSLFKLLIFPISCLGNSVSP